MRQLRAVVPSGAGTRVAALALDSGADRAEVQSVHGASGETTDVVVIAVSTSQADSCVRGLLDASWFDVAHFRLESYEQRAVIDDGDLSLQTRPTSSPAPELVESAWQHAHITTSLVMRTIAAGCFIAYGFMYHSDTALTTGLVFMPVFTQLLSVSAGLRFASRRLTARALSAFGVLLVLMVGCGAGIAAVSGHHIQLSPFEAPMLAFILSVLTGVAGALASSDDTGGLSLMSIAGATQLALVPVWFGAALVTGFPASFITQTRLLVFGMNVVTLLVTALITYRLANKSGAGLRRWLGASRA